MFSSILLLISLITCCVAIRCPEGILYLAGHTVDEYLDCSAGILRKCEEGLEYSKEEGECQNPELFVKRYEQHGIHERVSMGEVVKIGSLYDVRTGLLYNGFNLWSEETLAANLIRHEGGTSTTEFLKEESARDKAKNFDIGAEIELDFLAGLIKIKGSANYLNDHKKTTNKVRVVMKGRAIHDIYDINMRTPVDYESLCNVYTPDSGPSHVVVRITEGQRSFFVFDKLVDDESNSYDIHGDLQASVMDIPSLSVEGSVVVDTKGTVVENIQNTDVRFYGDALLSKFPVTYTEAVAAYKETVEDSPNTTPISFYLAPITSFCAGSEEPVVNTLTSSLINKASQYISDLKDVEAEVNTLLESDMAVRYESIRTHLQTFKSKLLIYACNFKSSIANIIPDIKSKALHELKLSDILVGYEKSSFEKSRSMAFLDRREREINAIAHLINDALKDPNMSLSDHTNAVDNKCMFNGEHGNALVLGLLPSETVITDFLSSTGTYTEQLHWYEGGSILSKISFLKSTFESFAAVNSVEPDKNQCFLLKLTEATSEEEHEIHLFDRGEQFEENFMPPPIPPQPECPEEYIGSNSLKIISRGSNFTQVSGQEVLLEQITASDVITKSIRVGNTDSFILDNLSPFSEYSIRTRYTIHTVEGADHAYSKTSKSSVCITRPTSPPSVFSATQVTSDSLTLSWYKPDMSNPALSDKIIWYSVEVYQSDNLMERQTTEELSCTVNDLQPNTVYWASISSQLKDESVPFLPSLKATKEFKTGPPAPKLGIYTGPHNFYVLHDNKQLVGDAALEMFMVKYYKVDNTTKQLIPGTDRYFVEHSQGKSYDIFDLPDLAPNTKYGLQAKLLVRSGGALLGSQYSAPTYKWKGGATKTLSNAIVHLEDSTVQSLKKVSEQAKMIATYTSHIEDVSREKKVDTYQTVEQLKESISNLLERANTIEKADCTVEGLKYISKPLLAVPRVDSLQSCLEKCTETDSCEAISVENKERVLNCYLYSTRNGIMETAPNFVSINFICYSTSSVKVDTFNSCSEKGVAHDSTPLAATATSASVYSIGECVSFCQNVEGCQGVTLTPNDNNVDYSCQAMDTRRGSRQVTASLSVNMACLAGHRSQTRGCTSTDTVWPRNAASASDSKNTVTDCIESCYKREQCQTVSYRSSTKTCDYHSSRGSLVTPQTSRGWVTVSIYCIGLKNI